MGKKISDLSDLGGMVFSTDPDFEFDEEQDEVETLAPEKQKLKVFLETIKKKNKKVTVVDGFIGTDEDIKALAKMLKTKCGVGGSIREDQILIQGEYLNKVKDLLKEAGYVKVK